MKKVILDAASNAYLFDGTRMENMGKAEKLQDVYNGMIFALGKDLYLKAGETYTLFAQNAELFAVTESEQPFKKQFELIGDVLLMINPNKPGFKKLEKEYAKVFLPQASDRKPLFVLKTKDGKYRVYTTNGENGFSPSETMPVCLHSNVLSFWWPDSGCGYTLNSKNELIPVYSYLIYQNDAYAIFNVAGLGLRINKAGELKALGGDAAVASTIPENIVLRVGNGYWHLGKKDVQHIATAYERESCSLAQDGTVTYEGVREYLDGPDIYITNVYQLKGDAYECVKHEER